MLATLSRASPSAASSSAARHVKKYLLVAPDSTDAGALQRRLDVRARHLEGATASFKGGLVAAGGALLSADELPADPSQPLPFAGSMLIITAPTMAAARDLVESDIYFTSNVWDKERLQIWPFAEVNFPQVVASTAEALQSEEHS